MPFRICKTIEIENGHMLSQHPGLCRFPHGHSRRVEFVLEADSLDRNGMVCDFKIIKTALQDLLDRFDHALCLNSRDPLCQTLREACGDRIIVLPETEPTTEVLARLFFDEGRRRLAAYGEQPTGPYTLRPNVRLLRVRVWETSSSWAEYEASPEG